MSALITSRRVKRYYAGGKGFATERAAARHIAKKRLRDEVVKALGLPTEAYRTPNCGPDCDEIFGCDECRDTGNPDWLGNDRDKWRAAYDRMYFDGHWSEYGDGYAGPDDTDREMAYRTYKGRLTVEIERVLEESRAPSLTSKGVQL